MVGVARCRRVSGAGLLVVGFLFVVSCGSDKGEAGKAKGAGGDRIIAGTVADAFGKPIAGAEIVATGGKAVTNDQGAFELAVEREPRRVEVTISKPGYTERRAETFSNQLAATSLVPVPKADGVYLVGTDDLQAIAIQTLASGSAPGMYKRATAVTAVAPGRITLVLVGFEASHLKSMPEDDEFAFGPGLSLSPIEEKHPITGGGTLITQSYAIPKQSGLRLALANFINPPDVPASIVAKDARAVLLAVE